MSFTSDVKHQICQSELDEKESRARLCGLLLSRASIHRTSEGRTLSFQSENASVAKYVYSLFKNLYHIDPGLSVLRKMRLKKNNTYRISIGEESAAILADLTILTETGLHPVPSYAFLRSEKNARAFLSGCFMAAGSVNHPRSTSYHMEMSCDNEKLALLIRKQLERFYIPSKITTRKNQYVVYIKQSEKIADFLRLVNASDALFEFEDSRIQRDLYNQIQRLDNCELANEMKSVKAGHEQLEYIRVLDENASCLHIPEKIQRAMYVRRKYPDASVNELCEEMLIEYGESISKSGMKHRLSKIKELAAPFMKGEGQ